MLIKKIAGNLYERITGDDRFVDHEWNSRQMAIPDKKSWLYLIVGIPLALLVFWLIASNFA